MTLRPSSTPISPSGSNSRTRRVSSSRRERPGFCVVARADSLFEIAIEDVAIHRGERGQVGDRRALVHLMHGLPDQAEFEHRAIVLDETCVRRAASGRELWRVPGYVLDRAGNEIDEWTGIGHKRTGVRRLPVDVPADPPGRGGGPLLNQ